MSELILSANLEDSDNFYADLLAAHAGQSKSDSDAFNARLVLVLANHIGDSTILKAALKASQIPE